MGVTMRWEDDLAAARPDMHLKTASADDTSRRSVQVSAAVAIALRTEL